MNKGGSEQKIIIIAVALLIFALLGAGYVGYLIWGPKGIVKDADKTQVATEKPVKTKKIKKITKSSDKDKKTADKDKKSADEDVNKTEDVNQDEEEKSDENIDEVEPKENVGINLADIASDFLGTKPEKDSKPKSLLDAMPNRNMSINNPFALKKEVIKVEESEFTELQQESIATAGKYNPFTMGDILSSQDDDTSNTTKPIQTTTSLPDIPQIPDIISFPPEITGQIPTITNLGNLENFTGSGQQNVQQNNSVVTNTNVTKNIIDSTTLTGIIGNRAILQFGKESRGLQAGQNYKGIVVLSISDKSVVLESNGVKVIRELRDRF